ncbi:hypothetical protein ACFX13_031472 [Malus domestica]
MQSERILKRQTKRKSPIGSISMVESFDACPHEESEAHEEDDIDSGRRRRTLLLQLMARSPLANFLPKDEQKDHDLIPDFTEVPDFYAPPALPPPPPPGTYMHLVYANSMF